MSNHLQAVKSLNHFRNDKFVPKREDMDVIQTKELSALSNVDVLILYYMCPSTFVNLNSSLTGVQLYNVRRTHVVKDSHTTINRHSSRFCLLYII